MIELTAQQFDDFQHSLPWRSSLPLTDGRLMGGDVYLVDGDDPRLKMVSEYMDPADKTILEFGCLEGAHTVMLARACRQIVALEIRPLNIIQTLTRLFVHQISNARVVLADAREIDGRFGSFDIVFHAGVFYHLMNPVEHLFNIRDLAGELLLDTHYCTDDTTLPASDINYMGKTYRAYLYSEFGWNDTLSGVEHQSRWLHRDDLLQLLDDTGFECIHVDWDEKHPNGKRAIIAARKKNLKSKASTEMPESQRISLNSKLNELNAELALTRNARASADASIIELAHAKQKYIVDRSEVEQLKYQLTAVTKQSESLQKQLDEVRHCATWKVGRMLLSPFSRIARALSG